VCHPLVDRTDPIRTVGRMGETCPLALTRLV